VWLTGRAKDLIIRGGHNIDPQMIEEVLATHPSVAMAAAVGQPDAYAGELPMAFVAARPGTSPTPDETARLLSRAHPGACCRAGAYRGAARAAHDGRRQDFQPELRWRAIEHVLTGSAGAAVDRGHRDGGRRRAARHARASATRRCHPADTARQVLGAFAVACEVS